MYRENSRLRRVAAFILGTASATAVLAQAPAPEEEDAINYAYATVFGSGLYVVADETVQIYKLPFSAPIRSLKKHPWGLKLKFPVALGVYDFKPRDALEDGLPNNLETISFVPGVEFAVPLNEDWLLKPFANIGAGWDLDGGSTALIYSIGAKSYYGFDWKPARMTLGNQLHWVGSRVAGGSRDALAIVETGLDALLPLGFNIGRRRANMSIYVANYLYLDDIEFVRADNERVDIDVEYEVGVTFGADPPVSLWKFKAPRFGISYRFAGDLSAIRLTVGQPF